MRPFLKNTLNNIEPSKKRALIYIIKNENKTPEKVRQLIQTVVECGGIKYAQNKMIYYRDEALKILHGFPEGEVRDALEELVRYTTDRKY